MADNGYKIHVSNLKKNFGKLEVLRDISLDVREGEVVVLIGPFRKRKIHPAALSEPIGDCDGRTDRY